jgi:hypothetical protein
VRWFHRDYDAAYLAESQNDIANSCHYSGSSFSGLKIFAYANNHYAGHGPGTVKLFWDLFEGK